MYSNYQQYQQRGGKLPENEYQNLAQRASELIDYYTAGSAAQAEDMSSALCACECELVDCLSLESGAASAGILSENNDGYSVTYASLKERMGAIKELMKQYLTFPHNLLAWSGHSFV